MRRGAGRDATLRHPADLQIFSTDQGAQFTNIAFTDTVRASSALCSMDDRGRYLDNVFIERLWRSLKYAAVYLHELADDRDAERVIGSWFSLLRQTASAFVAGRSHTGRRLPGRPGRGRVRQPENIRAGNATALAASTIPLTSSHQVGRFRSLRARIQAEYTLHPPSDYPTNQDHLTVQLWGRPRLRTYVRTHPSPSSNRRVPCEASFRFRVP